LPESAAVNWSGVDSRYTPPASSTTMSPDIPAFSERTAVCAAASGQGWAEVQAVPVPAGDAYRVVVAARAGDAGATRTNAAASAATTPIRTGLSIVTSGGKGTVVPSGGRRMARSRPDRQERPRHCGVERTWNAGLAPH